MVEAVVLWNEPNNLSHWNFHLDPGWMRFADMVRRGSIAIRDINPNLPYRVGRCLRQRLRLPPFDEK